MEVPDPTRPGVEPATNGYQSLRGYHLAIGTSNIDVTLYAEFDFDIRCAWFFGFVVSCDSPWRSVLNESWQPNFSLQGSLLTKFVSGFRV